jgi:hypothetical protein
MNMNAIQLELPVDSSQNETCTFVDVQKKLDEMSESMSKVRKKLFAKMSEVEKICLSLQKENENLKLILGVENVSFKADEEKSIKIDA